MSLSEMEPTLISTTLNEQLLGAFDQDVFPPRLAEQLESCRYCWFPEVLERR